MNIASHQVLPAPNLVNSNAIGVNPIPTPIKVLFDTMQSVLQPKDCKTEYKAALRMDLSFPTSWVRQLFII